MREAVVSSRSRGLTNVIALAGLLTAFASAMNCPAVSCWPCNSHRFSVTALGSASPSV